MKLQSMTLTAAVGVAGLGICVHGLRREPP